MQCKKSRMRERSYQTNWAGSNHPQHLFNSNRLLKKYNKRKSLWECPSKKKAMKRKRRSRRLWFRKSNKCLWYKKLKKRRLSNSGSKAVRKWIIMNSRFKSLAKMNKNRRPLQHLLQRLRSSIESKSKKMKKKKPHRQRLYSNKSKNRYKSQVKLNK